jgi:hypothetical protein
MREFGRSRIAPRRLRLGVLVLGVSLLSVAGCAADAPPVIGTAIAGNGQATVSWSPPLATGSIVTSYVVTPYVGSVAQAPAVFSSTPTIRTVTGLTNGTTYTFTVHAINALGNDSARSAASNPVTPIATARSGWCDPTDTAVNDGHTASFFATYSTPKGPLSAADCQSVVGHLNRASEFASWFPTVAAAKAAGWVQATVWTPGQGIHFVDPARETGPFDPDRPNWLQYNGTTPTANLVGMMFLVESGASPPAGFAGSNDHWHNHDVLCIDEGANPFVIGEHVSDAFCAAIGGVNVVSTSQWMVHVWLPKYAGWDATDIFNNNHPSVQ